MMKSIHNSLLFICLTLTTFKTVESINCYQCSGTDSDNPFECTEYFNNDIDIVPKDCDNIHGALYCIKHVGRFEGETIDCFQCNSSTMECGDGLINLDGGVLRPTSCGHVYNAQYCIKQTGLKLAIGLTFSIILWFLPGGISTKRFCSSLDLGNYCNYVKQPGDKLEYRTCIYTCGSDGCNAASGLVKAAILPFLIGFHVFRHIE